MGKLLCSGACWSHWEMGYHFHYLQQIGEHSRRRFRGDWAGKQLVIA